MLISKILSNRDNPSISKYLPFIGLINAQLPYLVSLSEIFEDGLILSKNGIVCLQLVLGQQVRAHRRRDVQQRVPHTQQHAFLIYQMLAIASLFWHIICWQNKAFQAYHMLAIASWLRIGSGFNGSLDPYPDPGG
jgi:hypothetical protein